jgi:hypothetical protein
MKEDISNLVNSFGIGGKLFTDEFLISEFGAELVESVRDGVMPILFVYPVPYEDLLFDNFGAIITRPIGIVSIPFKQYEIIKKDPEYCFIDGDLYKEFTGSKTDPTTGVVSVEYFWMKMTLETNLHGFDVFDLTVDYGKINDLDTDLVNRAINLIISLVLDITMFLPWVFCEVMKYVASFGKFLNVSIFSGMEAYVQKVQTEIFTSENWNIPVTLYYTDMRDPGKFPVMYKREPLLGDIVNAILSNSSSSQSLAPTGFENELIEHLRRNVRDPKFWLGSSRVVEDSVGNFSLSTYYVMSDDLKKYKGTLRLLATKALYLWIPEDEVDIVRKVYNEGVYKLSVDLNRTFLSTSEVESNVINKMKVNINYLNLGVIPLTVDKKWSDDEGKTYAINNAGVVS